MDQKDLLTHKRPMNTEQLKLIIEALNHAGSGALWAFILLLSQELLIHLIWWTLLLIIIIKAANLIRSAMTDASEWCDIKRSFTRLRFLDSGEMIRLKDLCKNNSEWIKYGREADQPKRANS